MTSTIFFFHLLLSIGVPPCPYNSLIMRYLLLLYNILEQNQFWLTVNIKAIYFQCIKFILSFFIQGLRELYQFKQANPKADFTVFMMGISKFYQSYIERGLKWAEAEASASTQGENEGITIM